MSTFLAARIDDPAQRARIASALPGWLQELTPDVAPPPELHVIVDGVWVIAGSGAAAPADGRRAVSVGWTALGRASAMGTGSVPGAGALARWDDDALEVATDTFASRSVFVGATSERAVASTSQRLATRVLGVFEHDDDVLRWFLATGVLPPGRSYNAWLRAVPPATVARCPRVARPSWADTRDRPPFRPRRQRRRDAHGALRGAIETAVSSLADAEGWVSPLSGGVDSRALLLFWKGTRPSTVTWGTAAALDDAWSDAVVARRVAEAIGAEHRYVVVEPDAVGSAEVLRRFRDVGEGRIDHLGGYADGFALFRALHDSGVQAIVRGDEAFGWSRSFTTEDMYRSLGLSFGERVSGLPASLRELVQGQQLPEALRRRPFESLPLWRDRLYAGCRAPTVLAALNALKTPWVEIANPFLHREIAEVVRSLPDRWRTDKELFRSVVAEVNVEVPYARTPAITAPANVLADEAARTLVASELRELAQGWLGAEATDWLAGRAERPGAAKRGRREHMERVRRYVPGSLKAPARVLAGTPPLPARRWAFRAWLASSTCARLSEDASA